MSSILHDGIAFHYRESGAGLPFFFQHGLGGDVNQTFGLFAPPAGIRLITFDCRGHGQTRPLGPAEKISIASYADDLATLMDRLEIERAIVGGISMGAAVALNFTVRRPERVLAMVMSRPAWLEGRRRENVHLYLTIARLIREHGARRGQEIFRTSPEYEAALRLSVDVAGSLLRQFENPRVEEVVDILERIPQDQPVRTLDDVRRIRVPTLVLANRQDIVHPYEFGTALAEAIPGAEFRELTPKSVDRERYAEETQRFIAAFVSRVAVTSRHGGVT